MLVRMGGLYLGIMPLPAILNAPLRDFELVKELVFTDGWRLFGLRHGWLTEALGQLRQYPDFDGSLFRKRYDLEIIRRHNGTVIWK